MNSIRIAVARTTTLPGAGVRIRRALGASTAVLALTLVGACSSTENVKDAFVQLSTATSPALVRIHRPLSYNLEKVGKVQVAEESVWSQVGAIPQGDVFRQTGKPLLLNGAKEALMVISADRIQGFFFADNGLYVPVEHGAGVTVVRR